MLAAFRASNPALPLATAILVGPDRRLDRWEWGFAAELADAEDDDDDDGVRPS